MKCEFCGTINPNDSENCSFCGNPLSTTEHTLNNIENNGELIENNNLGDNIMAQSGMLNNTAMENNTNVSPVQTPVQNEVVDNKQTIQNNNSSNNTTVQNVAENNQIEVLTNDMSIDSEPTVQNGLDENIVTQDSMVNNPTSTAQSGEMTSNGSKEPKAKRSKAPKIIALIIIALLVLFGVGFLFLMKSPKSIFTNTTKRLYSSLEKTFETDYNTMYSNITIKPYISSDQNLNGIDKIINNVSLDLEGSIDYESKKFFYNINTKYSGKELLNVDFQYDKEVYLILNNIFENPIKFDNADMSDAFKKVDNKNISIVLKGYIDALNNSLKGDYFKSKNEVIEINNKKVKVKANTLVLTKTTANKIVKDMSKSLQNNKEFIKAFKEISGNTESDIEKSLKDMKINDDFKPANVIIYTTGIKNDVVKFSIESDEVNFDVQVGSSDNNLILSLKSNGINLKLDYTFNVKYNEKVKLKNMTNAVSYKEITTKSSEIITGILESEGFKALNDDVKNSMGVDLKSLLQSSLGESESVSTDDNSELLTQ